MGSRKRSARQRQTAQFREQLLGRDDGLGAAFARERARDEGLEQCKEDLRRERSCESKQRYRSRSEAQDAIDACAEHGTVGLSCYRCSYCHGWHLTSHPWD